MSGGIFSIQLDQANKKRLQMFIAYAIVSMLLHSLPRKISPFLEDSVLFHLIDLLFTFLVFFVIARRWNSGTLKPVDSGIAANQATVLAAAVILFGLVYYFKQYVPQAATALFYSVTDSLSLFRDELVMRGALTVFLLSLFAESRKKELIVSVIGGIAYAIVFSSVSTHVELSFVAFILFTYIFIRTRSILLTIVFVAASQFAEDQIVVVGVVTILAYLFMLLLARRRSVLIQTTLTP